MNFGKGSNDFDEILCGNLFHKNVSFKKPE